MSGYWLESTQNTIISWFSGGITSAVATKIAIISRPKDIIKPVFIETGSHHPDMQRFIKECEVWFDRKIEIIQDTRYKDHIDLISKGTWVNGPGGAECSRTLKKRMRQKYQKKYPNATQVFGFEYDKKEINRALRFKEQNPETNPIFPLIEKKLTKQNCFAMLERKNIEIPAMYKLGYSNNNCIGCVKGGKGYWNKIRKDFPETFERMSKVERDLGGTCIKGTYLDELDPEAGRNEKLFAAECDLFCEIELADIEHEDLKKIIGNESSRGSSFDVVGRE